MKALFLLIGEIFGYLFPLGLSQKLSISKGFIYSGYLSNKLNICGKNVYIHQGVTILNPQYIEIHDNTGIQKGCVITAIEKRDNIAFTPRLSIGRNVSIGYYNHITCVNEIVIDDDVLIGSRVTITDNSHGMTKGKDIKQSPNNRPLFSKGGIYISKNVWIGDDVVILPNVRIGEGAIIGAGSIVTSDIPSNSIVVGNKAKVISYTQE